MKFYIITIAMVIVLGVFMVFHVENDRYNVFQADLKSLTNDCAGAAILYYDHDAYSDGNKVFKKEEGESVIRALIQEYFYLDDNMNFPNDFSKHLSGTVHYKTFYFDYQGLTIYEDGQFQSKEALTYPYLFRDENSDFVKQITDATVIVTVDCGDFDFSLAFLDSPKLIRTSAYEFVGR